MRSLLMEVNAKTKMSFSSLQPLCSPLWICAVFVDVLQDAERVTPRTASETKWILNSHQLLQLENLLRVV